MTLADQILDLVRCERGLTDREITDRLVGKGRPQQGVNQMCNRLAARGLIQRSSRSDSLIGNFPASASTVLTSQTYQNGSPMSPEITSSLCEDDVKTKLKAWLEKRHWATVDVKWGHTHGIDVVAQLPEGRWYIEVKGCGSLQPMRVNYFIAALGELLQKMDDEHGLYSVAFPNMPQFRGLWNRLPTLAKQRTEISALFVNADGSVEVDGLDAGRLSRAKGAIRYDGRGRDLKTNKPN